MNKKEKRKNCKNSPDLEPCSKRLKLYDKIFFPSIYIKQNMNKRQKIEHFYDSMEVELNELKELNEVNKLKELNELNEVNQVTEIEEITEERINCYYLDFY